MRVDGELQCSMFFHAYGEYGRREKKSQLKGRKMICDGRISPSSHERPSQEKKRISFPTPLVQRVPISVKVLKLIADISRSSNLFS